MNRIAAVRSGNTARNFPKTGLDSARIIAERIRQAVENDNWPQRPIPVSVGVAALGEQTGNYPELLEMADKALYRSKQNGCNRVTPG